MPLITDAFIATVLPPEKDHAVHWDDDVKGFGLRVMASGIASYIAMGRLRGQAIQFTIGKTTLYNAAEGRERAIKALQDMREGNDPRDVRSRRNVGKLTDEYLRDIQPGTKELFHWDTEVKGFGIRVSPTGKVSYVVQGRVSGGREVRTTIGPTALLTIDEAREQARQKLREMLQGVDTNKDEAPPVVSFEMAAELADAKRQLAELRALVDVIERDRNNMREYIAELDGDAYDKRSRVLL